MKTIFSCLLLLSTCRLPAADAPALAPTTNVIVITCDGPCEYGTNVMIYYKNVRATDALMDLTCEMLAIYFSTNRAEPQTTSPEVSTDSQRMEMLVAKTNVVITQPDKRTTAQQAVYTATNELIVLTGDPVVDTPQGSLTCSNLYYDRLRNKLRAEGNVKTILTNKPGMNLFGTNGFGFGLPGSKGPSRKAADTTK